MAEGEDRGFYLNNRTISFILGLVSMITIIVSGVTVFNGYIYRIDQLEKRNVELLSEVNLLTSKIDELNGKIGDLTISLNRLEERSKR